MMYRPSSDFRLWDTWIFPAEDEFHLFHLQNPVDGKWDALGHAVSTDLVHWKPCETIPMLGPEGAWDSEGPLLTGMVSFLIKSKTQITSELKKMLIYCIPQFIFNAIEKRKDANKMLPSLRTHEEYIKFVASFSILRTLNIIHI